MWFSEILKILKEKYCESLIISLVKLVFKNKAASEKQQVTHKGIPIRITDDIS